MYIRRIEAIAKKEIRHILRDPFTLAMALFIPVFLVATFGIAIDLDVHNVRLAIFDQDNTQASRILYQTFTNSSYFQEVNPPSKINPEEALKMEKAKVALIIPKEFEQNLAQGRVASAQILVDGSDNSVVGPILNYLNGILNAATLKLAPNISPPMVRISPRYLFNPEQESSWFIVPGLSVVILAILSILLTALTVAREWETSSMELLLSTPVSPREIIAGKLLPYLIMGLIGAIFVYIAARVGFGIPFKGSHLLFFLGTFLFLCTYLSLGLLISVVAKKQQIAMQLAMLTGYMPSLLLSGFIFSIKNMPAFWQYFTMIFPARWYMQICRSCYLKDPSFISMAPLYGALILIWIVLTLMAVRRFSGRLE